MEEMNKYGIVLDGKMDEPVWDTVQEYSGFTLLNTVDIGKIQQQETFFRILPCEDRVYIGFKCMDPGCMDVVEATKNSGNIWGTQNMEIFLAPLGNYFEFYQFIVTYAGRAKAFYYSENGTISPDPYAPDWKFEIYSDENCWSAEVEIPLSSFYMTPNEKWNDTWLVNLGRTRCTPEIGRIYSSWSPVKKGFREADRFRSISGFPMRPIADALRISSAEAELNTKTDNGYQGTMTVKVATFTDDEYVFTSDHGDSVTITLPAGDHEFKVPCFFEELGKIDVSLSLKRKSDGKVFMRYYPVRVTYEPLKVKLSLPEYRDNFYPGQDYTKIVGTAIAESPVTLTLEGAGIPTQTVTVEPGETFQFDTPDFEIGEAWLTASTGKDEIKKKIRRLAPSEHTMTWVSGGNIILDGEPVLSRTFYALGRGSVVFNKKFEADDFYITPKMKLVSAQPATLIKGSEFGGGEAVKDQYPSEQMIALLDARIDEYKDKDFGYYYLTDEPECREVSPVYMRYIYEHIKERDPYHVVMICSRDAAAYVECADWFQAHPFLNPINEEDGSRTYDRPIHTMGRYVDAIVNLNRSDKCMGFLPTCFAYKEYNLATDYPTFDEIVAHTWAAMMHGGKTLWPYVYDGLGDRADVYYGFRYLFTSFAALEQLVLFGKRTTLTRSVDAEAVMYDNGDEKMFVLVNYKQEPQTVTLEGLSGTWHSFCHGEMITGNTFELKPLETVIGTSKVKDTGLPGYAETMAIVNKLESERISRGSLLFERTADIPVTVVAGHGKRKKDFKFFDGVCDNMGVTLQGENGSTLEFDISKVAPKFNKVVVHGDNLEGMKLLAGSGETWNELPVADKKVEQYCTTFLLAETVSPDALRLEFVKEKVGVYEFELF